MDDLLGIPVAVNIECAAGVTDNGTGLEIGRAEF